jgi:hypothetical protein
MKEEHKLKIGKRHQLIDLNKDNTNFRLHFECTSNPPDQSYQICVASQSDLDEMEISNLPYKDVIGTMSGNIVADKNKYENYFVVLRADQDCDVVVGIDLEPMELLELEEPIAEPQKKEIKYDWKMWALWIFIIIIVIALFIYIAKMNGSDPNSIVDEINNTL